MAEVQFKDSKIIQEFVSNLEEHYAYASTPYLVAPLYRTLFFTIANVLRSRKNKNVPKSGFIMKDTNGNFKLGAIMTYHSPEDGEDEADDDRGNFTIEFTFDENDMKDIDECIDNMTDLFVTCQARQVQQIMNARFHNPEYMYNTFVECIDTLVKYMDANATEDDEFILTCQGVFQAIAAVEDGKKVISIIPGEAVKQFIKNDASL